MNPMTESKKEILYSFVRDHRFEFLFIILLSGPFTLFFLIGLFIGNLDILDHSYLVSLFSYNGAIILAVLLVFKGFKTKISISLLYFIIIFSIIVLFIWRDIAFAGDITQAVIVGSKMLILGKNPYTVPEVPHANGTGGFRNTTYPYLPADLLTYTFLLGIMDTIASVIKIVINIDFLPGFNELGFLISNLIFMLISIFVITKIFDISIKEASLLGMSMFIILLWNNICLCMMFFIIGWYFYKNERNALTALFLSLSMLTKYFTGIFIVAFILEFLLTKRFKEMITYSFIPALLTLIMIFPFGIIETLKSTVFFYSSEDRMLDGSLGGSLFSEIALFTNTVQFIGVYMILGFAFILVISLLIKDLYTRMIISSLLSLLVISGMSAQVFPMIAFIFILSNQIILFENQLKDVDDLKNIIPH